MNNNYGSFTYLKNKIEGFNEVESREFHGSAEKAFDYKANYIWEEANTEEFGGFVLFGPNLAAYLNSNGEEFILSSLVSLEDFDVSWKANSYLYELSLADTSFRIVRPVGVKNGFFNFTYRTVIINHREFNYYKLSHPDNDLGSLIMFTDISSDDYAQLFVTETSKLLKNLSIVVESLSTEYKIGYPSLKVNDLVTNVNGPYWRYLHKWDLDAEGCFSKLYGEIEKSLQGAVRDCTNPTNIEELLDRASIEWKSILNL